MFQLRLLERLGYKIRTDEEIIQIYDDADDELRSALSDYAVLSNNQRIRGSMEQEGEHNRKNKTIRYSGSSSEADFSAESSLRCIIPSKTYVCSSCRKEIVSEADIFNHKVYPMHSYLHYMCT